MPRFHPSAFLPGRGSPLLGLFLVPSLVLGEGPSPPPPPPLPPPPPPSLVLAARLAALRLLPTLGRSGRIRSGLLLPGRSFLLSSAESSGLAWLGVGVGVRGQG